MPRVVPLGEDLLSLQQPFRGLWTSHLMRSFIPWFVLAEGGLVQWLSETIPSLLSKGMTDQHYARSWAFFLWNHLDFVFRRIK